MLIDQSIEEKMRINKDAVDDIRKHHNYADRFMVFFVWDVAYFRAAAPEYHYEFIDGEDFEKVCWFSVEKKQK